jgi:hypothetical protein
MRPSARTAALFGLGYLALVALAGLPLLRAPWPAVPMAPQVPGWLPGDGDPLYRLWWIDWLWSHPGALLESGARTDLLFAPFGVQLGLVQAQLVQGLAVLALRPLGDPALAYAVLWTLSFLFTASATAALAWDVSRSRPGAFLAGFVAAFTSPFFVHSLEHVFKYLGFGFVPLALLVLRRALERGGARAYGAVFAVSALILLSDWYNALYVLVGGAVLWVHRLATAPADRRGLLRRTAALAALLPPLALVLWWTLAPVLAREADTLRAPLAEQASLGVDALNVLLPHPYHPLWGRFTAERLHALPGNVFEKTAFFGWALPLALALLAWRERRDPALRPWLLLLAVFAVLSLGPALHWGGRPLLPLPGAWLGQVPGFAGSRAPGRYVVVSALALGVLAALLVARQRRPGTAALALGALALVELAPFAAPAVSLAPSPALARLARAPGRGAVLDVPFRHSVQRYVYDQTLHRRPTVGGYMIRFTPRYAAHPAGLPGFELARDPAHAPPPADPGRLTFALARLLGVEYVAVRKGWAGEGAVARLLASGLPLERVDEDAQVVLLRLDPGRVPEADAATIDAGGDDARLVGLGWSAGGARPGGEAFLWSEDTESAVALAPPPGARAATLDVLSYEAAAAGRRSRAVVEADGAAQSVDLPRSWFAVRVPVPPERTGPWVVRFRTATCTRPLDVEPARADRRCLALGLGRIAWSE